MFNTILVCLDGSKLAEQILPYAIEEAKRFNSKVILLQVTEMPDSVAVAAGTRAHSSDFISEEFQRKEEEAKNYLGKKAASLSEQGVNAEPVVMQYAPVGDAIVNYAHDNNIDLICLATHGHSGLGSVIFGSIADYVLKKSGMPILLIKPA